MEVRNVEFGARSPYPRINAHYLKSPPKGGVHVGNYQGAGVHPDERPHGIIVIDVNIDRFSCDPVANDENACE